jgi:hypothetical protein
MARVSGGGTEGVRAGRVAVPIIHARAQHSYMNAPTVHIPFPGHGPGSGQYCSRFGLNSGAI